jgi:hypothetical protein
MSYLKVEKMPTFICGACRSWRPNAQLWKVIPMNDRETGVCQVCSVVTGLAERVAKREAEAEAEAGGE